MDSLRLSENATFQWRGRPSRIERRDSEDQVLVIETETGQMHLTSIQDLLRDYQEGNLVVDRHLHPGEARKSIGWQRPLETLPTHSYQEMMRRKHYIDWLSRTDQLTFIPHKLAPVLAAAAEQIGDPQPPSATTAYRWLRRFTHESRNVRALIPDYEHQGNRSPRFSEAILQFIHEALEEAFQQTPAATMKTVEARFGSKLDRYNASLPIFLQLKSPTRRTLHRVLARMTAHARYALTDNRAGIRQLSILKDVQPVKDILARVEIDHSPLDLFLIDEKTWLPLGRPTLTLALDCYSRMPLGYYLSFGGTSATAVLGVLRHSILPKAPTPAQIPGLTVDHEWPCYGRMDALVLDNGSEFHSNDLEHVALDLGIRLQYCPARVPQFKGRVERMLKTINYSFAHQLPGTSLARFIDRGNYDPQKWATLTLGEFKHALEKWFLDIYAQTIHRGIKTTPWAKWQEGLGRHTPELPASPASLKQRIGKSAERSLRHDGLWLHGIRYSCEELNATLQSKGRGQRVKAIFDPEDLGSIQVWPPGMNTAIIVPAIHAEYAQGLTLLQHSKLQELLREDGRNVEDPVALGRARQNLAETVDALMHSRKQGLRRKGAQIHGKTSEQPDRYFAAPTTTQQVARIAPPGPDTMPIGKYAVLSKPGHSDGAHHG